MSRLAGKVAIITGAASGQGRAVALLFARQGARVLVSDINQAGGEETRQKIQQDGGEALFQKTDVAKADEVRRMIDRAAETWGGLHILYNNAAIWSPGKIDHFVTELAEENWERIISTNLKSVYLCCKYGIPALASAGGGSVINVASTAGLVGSKNPSHAYAASKGGVIAMSRAMAMAYAKQQVRVNVICPGGVDTPMIDAMQTESGKERMAKAHPLGRMGTPDDIAYCALYLAADESAWVTGSVFPIDGGFTAK